MITNYKIIKVDAKDDPIIGADYFLSLDKNGIPVEWLEVFDTRVCNTLADMSRGVAPIPSNSRIEALLVTEDEAKQISDFLTYVIDISVIPYTPTESATSKFKIMASSTTITEDGGIMLNNAVEYPWGKFQSNHNLDHSASFIIINDEACTDNRIAHIREPYLKYLTPTWLQNLGEIAAKIEIDLNNDDRNGWLSGFCQDMTELWLTQSKFMSLLPFDYTIPKEEISKQHTSICNAIASLIVDLMKTIHKRNGTSMSFSAQTLEDKVRFWVDKYLTSKYELQSIQGF